MTSLFVLLNHPVAHHSIPSRENKSHPSARFSLSVSSFLCPFPPERLSAPLPPPPPHCLFQKVASDERRSPRRPQHDAKAARRAQLTRPSCSSTVQLAARTRRPLSFLFQFQVTGSPPSRSFLLLLPQPPYSYPQTLCVASPKDTLLDLRYRLAALLLSCVIFELETLNCLYQALVSAIYHSSSPIVSSTRLSLVLGL